MSTEKKSGPNLQTKRCICHLSGSCH